MDIKEVKKCKLSFEHVVKAEDDGAKAFFTNRTFSTNLEDPNKIYIDVENLNKLIKKVEEWLKNPDPLEAREPIYTISPHDYDPGATVKNNVEQNLKALKSAREELKTVKGWAEDWNPDAPNGP